jgi:glycosyltransferase involved in cell wall biosynthesis
VRVLLVHNRYRSHQPSGENAVFDDEAHLLESAGCTVKRLETRSDEIATWPRHTQLTLPARVVWSRAGYRTTAATIASFRPDVVHFHNTFPLISPSALWAARRSGAAVVQTLHNFRPLCPAGSFFRDGEICELCLGRLPVAALAHGCYRHSRLATTPIAAKNVVHDMLGTWRRCVDVFLTPSEFARQKYIEAGWPAAKLTVKPNTVPEPDLRCAEEHGAFVFAGRIERAKGVDLLLEAWREAFSANGTHRLLLVGPETDDTADAVRRAGVEFVGSVEPERALRLIGGARALVVPSRSYEVFPRVVAEAYAFSVPVVTTRVGPLGDLVEHGRTGLVVEPGSAVGLAAALSFLASSDEATAWLGHGARRAYETKYSPKSTTARLLETYERVISERRVAA